jgi:hypothetical protein
METMRRGSDKLALEKKGQECYNNVVSACVWTLIQRQIAGTKFSRILQTSFLFIYILTQRGYWHHSIMLVDLLFHVSEKPMILEIIQNINIAQCNRCLGDGDVALYYY